MYKDIPYNKFKIPKFKIRYLENVLNFLDSSNIKYRLKSPNSTEHFQPIYVDSRFNIQDFSRGEKVLIFEKSPKLMSESIEYLNTLKWGVKTIYLAKDSFNNICNIYKDDEDLYNILKNSHFHYALIFGKDKSMLEQDVFRENVAQKRLF